MIGLALEGGGSKGAYQIGAYKALLECGYHFDGVVGTSIGAINAALIAQGDWERAENFWSTMNTEDLFLEKDRAFLDVINNQTSLNTLSILKNNISRAIKEGGIDTSAIRHFLEQNIDPDRLLASQTDFGMVALSVPDLQPLCRFKNEMHRENIIDHILASASFPGFQQTDIDGKKYVDGGFYDACPYNMLLEKGYDNIIAIRLHGFGLIHTPKDKSKVTVIEPSWPLGPVMKFDAENSKRNILMGYYDTIRLLKHLPGKKYVFSNSIDAFSAFSRISEESIGRMSKSLHISTDHTGKRCLFEKILPLVAEGIGVPKSADYNTLLTMILEYKAERLKIDPFGLVTYEEMIDTCRTPGKENHLMMKHLMEAVNTLCSELP